MDEKIIVSLLYDYCEYLKNDDEFYNEFKLLISSKDINSKDWIKNLKNKFEQISGEDFSVTGTEFRYEIMKTLQTLKNKGLYTDIILNDYQKYL